MPSKNARALEKVKGIMKAEGLYLFCGQTWMVHLVGLCTKALYSTAAQFVGDLCANPDNMDLLFGRRKFLVDVLGDEHMLDEIYCPLIVGSETRCFSASPNGLSSPWKPTSVADS